MISHIPRSSRIFIGLLIITLLLTYVALTLSMHVYPSSQYVMYMAHPKMNHGRMMTQTPAPNAKILSTSDWKSYQDKVYPISFLYPKTWAVKASMNPQKFYDITVDVPKTDSDLHIYISPSSYFGLNGYMQQPYMVGNAKGEIAGNNLVGVKTGEYYYTFDASVNSNINDEFATLLRTVNFK